MKKGEIPVEYELLYGKGPRPLTREEIDQMTSQELAEYAKNTR